MGMGIAMANASMGNPALYLALLCFPTREIARCRRVCRLWRDITSTVTFRRHHHDHHFRTLMPLFFFLDPKLVCINLRAVDICNRESRPVIRFTRRRSNHGLFRVHGSCASILLLSYGPRLYACNPCTRRWARLLPLHLHHDIIGFYVTHAHGPGGDFEFKVLYHDRMGIGCVYWIFTLGAASALARRCFFRPCSIELDPWLALGIAPSHKIPPVFSRGFLHWPPKAAQHNDNVIMFDVVAEAFSFVFPPRLQLGRQLFEIDECLAMTVISFDPKRVHVWVLGDDITGLWNRRYSIVVPVDEIKANNSCHHNGSVFAVAQGRNALVQCPRVLLQCDDQGAVLKRYCPQHPHH
ncbi:hypothetical protein ACQ4PT_027658 [Festuca glaucescens]